MTNPFEPWGITPEDVAEALAHGVTDLPLRAARLHRDLLPVIEACLQGDLVDAEESVSRIDPYLLPKVAEATETLLQLLRARLDGAD